MNIRKLAHEKGHDVKGKLKRISDDKFFDRYENYRVHKRYIDEEGTLYAVDELKHNRIHCGRGLDNLSGQIQY